LAVVLHGFNVSQLSATSGFIPSVAKRLYWAGHPVLEGQPNATHLVGVVWPGNFSPPGLAQIPGLGSPAPYFVVDEYLALQTSVPLSRFIAEELKPRAGSGRVLMIAHSLGNLVANATLARLPQHSVDTVVMVDAAVTAEAFRSDYIPTFVDAAAVSRTAAAVFSGASTDERWNTEWELLTQQVVTVPGQRSFLETWRDNVALWQPGVQFSDGELRNLYTQRWTKYPNGAGPWRGLFASNPHLAKLVNIFNSSDQVYHPLLGPWTVAHTALKAAATDNGIAQLWAAIGPRPGEIRVFDHQPAESAEVVESRRWAELAFWFPALAQPAGVQAVDVPSVTNCDMTAVGGSGGLEVNFTSHTYITGLPVWTTTRLYKEMVGQLRSPRASCYSGVQ
jgi:pimeloyl-ACP methyl ester carboxylesterase